MIKANELRIGNWISNGEKNYTVDVNMLYDMFTSGTEIFSGIPLTPDIVEGCGFERQYTDERDLFYSLKLTKDLYNPLSIISTLVFDEDCPVCLFPNKSVNDFKYVHQLQNLYFALTGKELEIKLLIPAAP